MLTLRGSETAIELASPGWERFPWLRIAYGELLARVTRFTPPGAPAATAGALDAAGHAKNNPRILEYFQATKTPVGTEGTSWCSAFVNWCMFQAGIVGTRDALARSWLHWPGRATVVFGKRPPVGCIVVFPRPPSEVTGHVGFVWRARADGTLDVLAGNQSEHQADPVIHGAATPSHVSIAHFVSQPLGLIWPSGWALPDEALAPTWIASAAAIMPKDLLPPSYRA